MIRERFLARTGPAFLLPHGTGRKKIETVPKKPASYPLDFLGPMNGGRKPEPMRQSTERKKPVVRVARIKRISALTKMTPKLLAHTEPRGGVRLLALLGVGIRAE